MLLFITVSFCTHVFPLSMRQPDPIALQSHGLECSERWRMLIDVLSVWRTAGVRGGCSEGFPWQLSWRKHLFICLLLWWFFRRTLAFGIVPWQLSWREHLFICFSSWWLCRRNHSMANLSIGDFCSTEDSIDGGTVRGSFWLLVLAWFEVWSAVPPSHKRRGLCSRTFQPPNFIM